MSEKLDVAFLNVLSIYKKALKSEKARITRLGGLSLPRKSVVRLTDRPDMALDVYRGRKTTTQQQQQQQSTSHLEMILFPFQTTDISKLIFKVPLIPKTIVWAHIPFYCNFNSCYLKLHIYCNEFSGTRKFIFSSLE